MATYTSPEKYNELKEAIIGGDYGTVTGIVESGYDVNTIDAFLQLPLHYAVLYDQVKIVEYLVSQGAFVRYPPWPKWYTYFTTPFHCAIRKDNLSLAEYLYEEQASGKNDVRPGPYGLPQGTTRRRYFDRLEARQARS